MDGNDGNLPFMRSAWTFHLQVRGNEHQPWHFKPSVGTWWASQSFYPIRIRLDIFGSGPSWLQSLKQESAYMSAWSVMEDWVCPKEISRIVKRALLSILEMSHLHQTNFGCSFLKGARRSHWDGSRGQTVAFAFHSNTLISTLLNTDLEKNGWWWWQLFFHEVCFICRFGGLKRNILIEAICRNMVGILEFYPIWNYFPQGSVDCKPHF